MTFPGFTADVSLYRSQNQYHSAVSISSAEASAPLSLSGDVLDSLSSRAIVYAQYRIDASAGRLSDTARKINIHNKVRVGATPAVRQGDTYIVPMSVPGHQSDPGASSQCSDCTINCGIGFEGCQVGVASGCSGCFGLLAIPIIGGGLAAACYSACVIGGMAACYASSNNCFTGCHNIGSPCCPVDCGVGCCNYGETCLDSSQGLCCSQGMQPCRGPQESCYDPTQEICLPSGIGCPVGQECGSICCGDTAQCVDPSTGNCCPLLTGIPCGNQCCNSSTESCTPTGCCPINQACAGGTCCPTGTICENNQCVAVCQPGQFLCVSADGTKQNCCPGGADCCDDGSCCQAPNMCCEALGCVPVSSCFG
jgi:hypothetical protein